MSPRPAGPSRAGATPPRGQRGYNMVILVVLITILNILLALALPAWSNMIRREKEEELIFRGLQYAEAIRVFRRRFGRPPVRLEELIEVEPRSIRQLWPEPMTASGKWGLLFESAQPQQQQQQQGAQGRQQGRQRQPQPAQPGRPGQAQLVAVPPGGDGVRVGPIAGVYSPSSEESIKVFNGADHYDQWQFTYQLLAAAAVPNAAAPGGLSGHGFKTEWVGRPYRQGVTPPGVNAPGQLTGINPNPVDAEGRPVGEQPIPPPGSPSQRPPE